LPLNFLPAGAFALLPYFALWQQPKQPAQVPAPPEALQGKGNLMQKGMETRLVAFLCLAGAAYCVGQAAFAGVAQWNAYFKLLEESRCGNVCKWVLSAGAANACRAPRHDGLQLACEAALPFRACRFINVMTVDFLCLTALAPFWMAHDAGMRKWEKRDSLIPVLSLIPLFGPAIYLCLRPRSEQQS
jgi:hypothetical protein